MQGIEVEVDIKKDKGVSSREGAMLDNQIRLSYHHHHRRPMHIPHQVMERILQLCLKRHQQQQTQKTNTFHVENNDKDDMMNLARNVLQYSKRSSRVPNVVKSRMKQMVILAYAQQQQQPNRNNLSWKTALAMLHEVEQDPNYSAFLR